MVERLASRDAKRQILKILRDSEGKYSKPFTKGNLAGVSFLGGSWNEYAQVLFSMMLLDTMLNIEELLEEVLDELLDSFEDDGDDGDDGDG